jgi:hypothetical protein
MWQFNYKRTCLKWTVFRLIRVTTASRFYFINFNGLRAFISIAICVFQSCLKEKKPVEHLFTFKMRLYSPRSAATAELPVRQNASQKDKMQSGVLSSRGVLNDYAEN